MSPARHILDRTITNLVASMGIAALLCGASPALAQTAPPLGRVQSFAVLGGSAVTAAGAAGTVIGGDVGSAPTPSVSGFPPALVTAGFTLYQAANAVTAGARTDAGTAFVNLAGQPCPAANNVAGGILDSLNLVPGVYCMPTGSLTGTLTLTGGPAAVWVFQMTLSTLTTASASQVVMAGGANACNVFWQVSSSATLGSSSTLRGNIFSGVSIGLGTTSHVIGRVIAGTGAVTMDGGNAVDGCSSAGAGLAATTVSTVASAGVTLGGAISDTATLSGGGIGSAAPTGTITFSVYGPNDPICDSTAKSTSVVTVNGNGTYSSGPFTPLAIGTYRWRAAYSGDANNAATITACADEGESVIVSAAVIPPAAAGVPTLSGWGLMTLMVLIALASIYRLRRI